MRRKIIKIKAAHLIGATPRLAGAGNGPFVKMTGVWGDGSPDVAQVFSEVFGSGRERAEGYPRITAAELPEKMERFASAMRANPKFVVRVDPEGLFGWPEVTVEEK